MAKKEEKANPYNMKKSWHNVEDKQFVSSESVYFPDPESNSVEENTEESVQEEQEIQAEQKGDYKRPDYKKRYDDLKKHYDSKLNEFKQKELELTEQAQQGQVKYTPPKSEEELAEFKQKSEQNNLKKR